MKTRRRNYNNDENKDRLSDLSDCVLLRILSFLNTKDAVQTSILSTRWKNLWKHIPFLSLGSHQFKTVKGFTKFMSQFLSLRDASAALRAVNIYREGIMECRLVERVLNYAVLHDVQRIRIDVKCDIQNFPSCLFSCRSLTSLCFFISPTKKDKILFPNLHNLPSLTYLCIENIIFLGGADPFSALPKLNRLEIYSFQILGEENLRISSTSLVKLTISPSYKLESSSKIELSTPGLCSLVFLGTNFQILCASHLSSVEHIQFYATMFRNHLEDALILLSWLVELVDIKSLEIESDTLQVLSLVPDLLKIKLHSLCNLKSVRINMKELSYTLSNTLINVKIAQMSDMPQEEVAKLKEVFKEGSSSVPDGIINFLLHDDKISKCTNLSLSNNIYKVRIRRDCFNLDKTINLYLECK